MKTNEDHQSMCSVGRHAIRLIGFSPILLLSLCSIACFSPRDGTLLTKDSARATMESRAGVMRVTIPPDHCRIAATVTSIDTSDRSSDPTAPCSKAPCHAWVRVDSVIGYGQAFTRPLVVGESISVTFIFTVAPTRDLLPSMENSYPGVHLGTRIITDLRSRREFAGQEKGDISFSIAGYLVQ